MNKIPPAVAETDAPRHAEWIEFTPSEHQGKVKCCLCGRLIGHQRVARGTHTSWHMKNLRLSRSELSTTAQP